MGRIQILDSSLANQIAAGEVVERPSSVVKELVENSIDANAHKIIISLEDAGRSLISVEDDGVGMDRDDAVIAFKRHATSKIKSTFDLFRIKTLGFSGEALPSISSVAHVTLYTSDSNSVGTRIDIDEESMKVHDYAMRKGTLFEVRDLFYNTPARLKYMKADATENANTVEVVSKIALAHPEVAFTLYIDGRKQFETNGRGDLLEVISSIYGIESARKMVPFTNESIDVRISGFIGRPEIAKSSRYYIITLLNGRPVYMPKVQSAIIDAYHDFLPPTRYPFVVLNLNVDVGLVDVNVHPSKREVRFSKEDELRRTLLEYIPITLRKSYQVVESTIEEKEIRPYIQEEVHEQIELDLKDLVNDTIVNITQDFVENNQKYENSVKEQYVEQSNFELKKESALPRCKYRALAQLQKTYIIAEDDEGGFILVDQHAAYERINYEKYQKLLNEEIKVQEPLVPIVIELNNSDYMLLHNKINLLEQIGLRFDEFGKNSFKVVQVPSWINEVDEKQYIEELIEQVLRKDNLDIHMLRTDAIATIACKASIKAHDYLNVVEMQYILDRLFVCENPSCCPHGRPTIIAFNKYQLEKLFKRTGV